MIRCGDSGQPTGVAGMAGTSLRRTTAGRRYDRAPHIGATVVLLVPLLLAPGAPRPA